MTRCATLLVGLAWGCGGGPGETSGVGSDIYDWDCRRHCCDWHTGCIFYSGPILLQSADGGCSGTTWRIEARTQGWTSDVVVDMADTRSDPSQLEEHRVPSVSFGPGGYWDEVQLDLQPAADPAVPGESTAFDCDEQAETGAMTYALRVFDSDGLMSDCWVWGHDPEVVLQGAFSSASAAGELASCTVRR